MSHSSDTSGLADLSDSSDISRYSFGSNKKEFEDSSEFDNLIMSVSIAVVDGNLDTLKNIIKSIPEDNVSAVLSRPNRFGYTSLMQAIMMEDVTIIKFLLKECHVDPMVISKKGYYSLNIAIEIGHLRIVKMLIESKAKLDVSNTKCYEDPLSLAFKKPNKVIFDFLIENCEDIDYSKCLMISFEHLRVSYMEYFLESGANVNFKNEQGLTPIHLACQCGRIEAIKLIAERGADHYSLYKGLTPLQRAALNYQVKIVNFYSDKCYYTQQEVWDCFDLLGVGAIACEDLNPAIMFWNRVLNERSQSGKDDFISSFFRYFQYNLIGIEDYRQVISDLENAAIYSFIIYERVLGFEHRSFNSNIKPLLELISLTNITFWEAIVRMLSEINNYDILYTTGLYLTQKFIEYIQSLQYKNINSSLINVFREFVDLCLRKKAFKPEYYSTHILNMLTLYSIKEHSEDLTSDWFHTVIKTVLNPKISDNSILHTLLLEGFTWEFPDRVILEVFELCCKFSGTVNYLNGRNKVPLYAVLSDSFDAFIDAEPAYLKILKGEFIRVLMKYGALTDTKSKAGKSIRKLAIRSGRQYLCIGSPSLQTFVNAKVKKKDIFDKNKNIPAILVYYTLFH